MCILCTPRPIYRSTYRLILDRYVGWTIGQHSANTVCRPRCVSQHMDRRIGWALVDNRSICRPRVVVRSSADMSIDRLLTFRRYFTATVYLHIGYCSFQTLFNFSVLLDNDWICGTWSRREAFRKFWGWPKKDHGEMHITYTVVHFKISLSNCCPCSVITSSFHWKVECCEWSMCMCEYMWK